jgi:hypothetical protein
LKAFQRTNDPRSAQTEFDERIALKSQVEIHGAGGGTGKRSLGFLFASALVDFR